MSRRRIYVASSWRNNLQPIAVAALRAAGHEVYDFRHPDPSDPSNEGFSWRQTETPNYQHGDKVDARTWRRMVDHPIAKKGFALDFGAMQWCDTCVFVLPAGRSASFEIGWCMGQGKRGIVLAIDPQEPELMFREATIVGSVSELLDALEHAPPIVSAAPISPPLAVSGETVNAVLDQIDLAVRFALRDERRKIAELLANAGQPMLAARVLARSEKKGPASHPPAEPTSATPQKVTP